MKKLETITEQSGLANDLKVGDTTYLTDWKTGLLLEATIVHKTHVPSRYVEQLSQVESDISKFIWAKIDLGGSHFAWHAIYQDAPLYEPLSGGVEEIDKFTNHHSLDVFKKEDDFHSDGRFRG